MLEYIYICRHGFRSNWVDPSIKTGPTGMTRDPPLAAYGVTQAEAVADFFSSPKPISKIRAEHDGQSGSMPGSSTGASPSLRSPDRAQAHSQNQTQNEKAQGVNEFDDMPHPRPERVFSSAFYRCIQTAIPTAKALGVGVSLEHGVGEWYSPVNPSTGLHPRPSPASHLAQYFPPSSLDLSYTPTLYPSRRGETLRGLQDRADLFVEAWTSRVEEIFPEVRCVVVFGHAASVIALGRALTGDKSLNIPAGCASTSLYTRKRSKSSRAKPSATTSSVGDSADTATHAEQCGVGEWEAVYLGRADYLVNGLERDWSFRDVVLVDGEVVTDNGDHGPHPPADELPEGLAPDMEKYLRRGRPNWNEWAHEAKYGQGVEFIKGRM